MSEHNLRLVRSDDTQQILDEVLLQALERLASEGKLNSQVPDEKHRGEPKSDAEMFDLQIAVDIEHERALLFRVFVVLELIGAMLLFREFMLLWLEI